MLPPGRDGIERLIEYGGTTAIHTIRHRGIGARPFVVPDDGDLSSPKFIRSVR